MYYFKKKHFLIKKKTNKVVLPLLQGRFGVFSLNSGFIYQAQYKAIIFFLRKKLKGYSKVFIRFSCCLPKTKKSIGVRMGKGKGAIDTFYMPFYEGQLLFEFSFLKIKELNKETVKWLNNLIHLVNMKSKMKLKLIRL